MIQETDECRHFSCRNDPRWFLISEKSVSNSLNWILVFFLFSCFCCLVFTVFSFYSLALYCIYCMVPESVWVSKELYRCKIHMKLKPVFRIDFVQSDAPNSSLLAMRYILHSYGITSGNNGAFCVYCTRFVGMSGSNESLSSYVHPELADCAKAVSKFIIYFFSLLSWLCHSVSWSKKIIVA